MSDPLQPLSPRDPRVAEALQVLHKHWRWFVVLGIVLLALGIAAAVYVLSATLISVLFVGVLMLVGGISQLIHAWRIKSGAGFVFWSISGMLYCAAGLLAIYNPMAGAAILTLLLGATLIGSGAFRLWAWFQNRGQPGWQWIALSGVITAAVGIIIAAGWPENSVWILGFILAIDLSIQGWTLLLLGFSLRKRG